MEKIKYILLIFSFFLLSASNIFADNLTLLVTSNVNGEIDPCG